jgi:putative DNA methylase
MAISYRKRLIEVDLPIKRISAHARREKSIRHGHISTLHIWWARRPLAACRAVICAALWPDPADENCPPAFRKAAAKIILDFAGKIIADTKLANEHCSPENYKTWSTLVQKPPSGKSFAWLRTTLLDFIADFANWDNSTVREYLDTSRALTQAAHEALGGAPGTRPLIVDPFCGGGSIPLEALRVGADAFASDLNPIPILLNKVVLEYIPKYGQRLADEVRKWGDWIKGEAEKELAEFYPNDADGATPIAYLWARTIQCEGPGCGAEVPLIRFLWLARKASRSVALQLVPNRKAKCVDFQIIVRQRGEWVDQANPKIKIENPKFDGTVKRGAATCSCCGYTTPVARVREQLKAKRGGANSARLYCVVVTRSSEAGRFYRLPTRTDLSAVEKAGVELNRRKQANTETLSLVPEEKLDLRGIRHTWGMIYGFDNWESFFSSRQLVSLVTLTRLVREVAAKKADNLDLTKAVATCLALSVDKVADLANSVCRWEPVAECPRQLFARQAIPITWDFAEGVPTGDSSGSWAILIDRFVKVLASIGSDWHTSSPQQSTATRHPLPDDSANAFITDPPYYDAVPYAFLSDFFYVWLRRSVGHLHGDLFKDLVVPKDLEIIVDRPHELSNSTHDIAFYERELTKAFGEGRRVLRPDGIGTIVFASKTTASWEAILKAVVDAGWIITGSWPIDTEMENRVSAQGQARLTSSVHLVCRPRENPDGSVRTDEIGDWRDVLQELPRRIHEWMPRLAEEGVVGADAIFACLGPALEIFSRYGRVEKASGEAVTLKEFLEHVWAAVAKEALTMIFTGADTTGFEEDEFRRRFGNQGHQPIVSDSQLAARLQGMVNEVGARRIFRRATVPTANQP